MQSLDLSNNQIKSLSDINAASLLITNPKLQALNLSGNRLTDLGEAYDQILYSDSLLSLDVSRCAINQVQGPIVLLGLRKLSRLNLSKNPITRIDGLTSESLLSLDVSDCNIQFLRPDSFERLIKLKELRAPRNPHLNDQYWKPSSKSLTLIDVSYCALNSNYAIDLVESQTIILRGNRLREIPAYAFRNNVKLEVLDLSDNLVRNVDEFAFYGVESLRRLDLSANQIVALSQNTFTFNPALAILRLSQNDFSEAPLLKAASVLILDISDCRINRISDNALLHLPSLRTFNLSYNSVERLPQNLTSRSLQTLDLSYCRLAILNENAFRDLTTLKEIDLAGNRLVKVRNTTFAGNRLSRISLANNPWKCDCEDENFRALWQYLSAEPPKVADSGDLVCVHPESLNDKTWQDACYQEWHPGDRKAKDVIVLIIIIIVLLLSGAGACFIAVRENCKVRQVQNQEHEEDGGSEEGVERITAENETTIRESIRKFTQLPSYDEALLLPRPSSPSCSDSGSGRTRTIIRLELKEKRQSATQTEETIEELLREIGGDEEERNIEQQGYIKRDSLEELQYINIRPLTVQCTEL